MRTHLVWITLAVAPACTIGEGVTVYGEMSSTLSTAPSSIDLVLVYSPEQADHEAVGTTITGSFPTGFTLDVPAPRRAVVEASDAVDVAGGWVWIAKAGTVGTRADGFGEGELMQPAGYAMMYVVDDPGSSTPWGIDGMVQGWNLIRFGPLTCADRVPVGTSYGWNMNYELVPLDTLIGVQIYPELTPLPWDPPLVCP